MFSIKYEYSNKMFKLRPYTTEQEKNLLLLGAVDDPDVDTALEICGFENNHELTSDEKIALLYKYREISVGADVNTKFICLHCNTGNENSVDIENLVDSSIIKNDTIVDCFSVFNEGNMQMFTTQNIEEMELDVYESLKNEIEETVTKFNFIRPVACLKCLKNNNIDISGVDFTIDVLSEDTLMSIYQSYNDLCFFGNYTKRDVDSMYPFERNILTSLLTKTRESLNK